MLTATQIIAIKTKIKQLMTKRASTVGGTGLSTYGTATYDFTTNPATNTIMLADEGNKTFNLMFHVNSYPNNELTYLVESGTIIQDIEYTNLDNWLTTLDGYTNSTSSSAAHGCRAACTGLCQGTCYNTATSGPGYGSWCDGCKGGCGMSCTGCGGDCSASCTDGCYTGCSNGCYGSGNVNCGYCTTTCADYCGSSCANGCDNGCTSGCSGGCGSGCDGCGGSECTGQCAGGCYGQCAASCKNNCGSACTGCSITCTGGTVKNTDWS